MKLEHILPRPLGDSTSECAGIFTSLIMAAHFERTRARAIGWRGVRPSGSERPAWTCRVAGSDHIFGICFDGEEKDTLPASASAPTRLCLRGWFSLFVFPHTDSPILDLFPLEALQFGLSPMYADAVRNFMGTEPFFQPFCLGQLRLDVSFAGDALALTLEAPARHRVICTDGVKAGNDWLIRPGDAECDIPSFRLLMRLFAVLAATAEQQLGEEARIACGMSPVARMRFNASGEVDECPGEKEVLCNLTAAFGPSLQLHNEALRRLRSLPLRHCNETSHPLTGKPVLHVLTGFLGSGKTTFLRRWLDFLYGRERYTGVIQNEFGKTVLDAALIKGDTLVEALDEGCVCCSLADSLRPGLERIIAAMPAEQFVLETTGLANPVNIMEALQSLRDIVTPGLVVTVADALDLCGKADNNTSDGNTGPEAFGIRRAQLRKADIIIVNKSDTVSETAIQALVDRLQKLNAKALVLPCSYGNIPFAALDAFFDAHAGERLPSHRPHLLGMGETAAMHTTHSDEGYTAATLHLQAPVSPAALEATLHTFGPGLCRAKGIIAIEGQGPCLIQYAAGRLEITPAPDEEPLDLVLIGTGLNIVKDAGESA